MDGSDVARIITRNSRTSFGISFSLLPGQKREAINTVYAFCRCTDDIVDEDRDEQTKRDILLLWTDELERGFRNESGYPLLNTLSRIAEKFNIPAAHFFELIRGMQMDLEKYRYGTFSELEQYCFRVASTVGLMCSEIFGYRNRRTLEYAADLGIALQLTNIVRDVRADAQMGRIYLPLEDLERFSYSERELLESVHNDNFVRLMRFETQRARSWYERARSKLAGEDHRAFFAARIMDRIYFHTLDKIERRDFNVFEGDISISSFAKVVIALKEYFSPSGRRAAAHD